MKPTLEKRIERMLNADILDHNRPSQLTTLDAKFNYGVLTPAIKALIASEGIKLMEGLKQRRRLASSTPHRDSLTEEHIDATIERLKKEAGL